MTVMSYKMDGVLELAWLCAREDGLAILRPALNTRVRAWMESYGLVDPAWLVKIDSWLDEDIQYADLRELAVCADAELSGVVSAASTNGRAYIDALVRTPDGTVYFVSQLRAFVRLRHETG